VKRIVSSLALYPTGIVCLSLLYENTLVLTGVLLVLTAIALGIDRRPGDVWILIGGAVLGPVAEAVAVACGAWTYTVPDALGLPLWLPVAWGLATLLIKRITEIFERGGEG
jgi:hypothetical protein